MSGVLHGRGERIDCSAELLSRQKSCAADAKVSASSPPRGMAEAPGTSSETITETVSTNTPPPPQQEGRSLTIKLRKRKTEKKVEWSSDTVDNEHLGRRSSKCCCVYEKPKQFGESSSESEGEDDDEGCGSAHCILGHGRGGHGQMGGRGGATGPQSSGGSNAH